MAISYNEYKQEWKNGIGKEIDRVRAGNLTVDEKKQKAIKTSLPFSVSPKINFQQKKQDYINARNESVKANEKQLQSELAKRGYSSLNPIIPYNREKKLSNISEQEKKQRLNIQNEIAPIFRDVNRNTKATSDRLNKASNDLKLAQYQYDVDKVNNEKTTFWDKTGGNVTRALADMGSIFNAGANKYIDENGNALYLPSYNKLKQEKVREDYDTGVGRFLGDVAYNSTKILTSTGMNMAVPGSGTTLYWSDMFTDNLENAKAQGYNSLNAFAYSAIGTGFEYLTGKFLGSATKGLTGGKSSGLEEALNKGFNKLIGNKTISNILANAGSEATEEFIQEYLDNLNKLIILDENTSSKAIAKIFSDSDILSDALYSAAVGAASGGALSFINNNIENKNTSNIFKQQLEETKKSSIDKTKIEKINKVIELIDNQNKIKTVEDLVYQKQNDANDTKISKKNSAGTNQINDSGIVQYSKNEIENFRNGKVKVVQSDNDISTFIDSSKKIPSNAKLYFGKIGKNIASKINKKLGINIENYNISLKADSIKHILAHHSSKNETLRGQVPVVESDFKLIPEIVSNYDNVKQTGTTENGKPAITFEKQIGDIYYLVNYVSDKKHNLEVQTMYKKKKKNSATVSDANILRLTSETDSGTSSFLDSNNTTNLTNSQITLLPSQYNMQQNTLDDTKLPKIMNPNEVSKLTREDANTTPTLPKIGAETGNGRSNFYENVTKKTKMLDDNTRSLLATESDIEYYKEVTNKESLDKAFDKLNKNGKSEVLSWLAKDSNKATPVDVAEGWVLLKQYQDAINKTTDVSEKYELNMSMVEVAKKMREVGTKAGQTVQAFNILNRLTPEGMVYYAQSELSEAYDKMVKNKTQEWINKHKADFELTPDETGFILNTMKEISSMQDGYEKKVKLAEIQKLMTDKLPSTKGRAIKSWMRISMLFNPKTQVRNVVGNAIIAPVNYFGDIFSSYADKIISKKTGVRTTGNMNVKAILKGLKRGAYEATNDFKKGINTKDMSGNRFEISDGKSFSEKTLIGKTLNRTESLLNYVMDVGDRIFSEASFENSLQNQMVLNNTTEVTQEMIDIARKESLSRTWNDNNNYTNFVLEVRRMLNKAGIENYGLGDILIPFAKTPANLTKAIVDYSPLGLVQTISDGVKLNRSLDNGQYNAQMQHKFVQNLGKATAGTMLYILGYALAKSKITSGKSDDDKDVANFLKNTLGVSSYSIKIGNKSFTYDWAQPIAAPLSIMANIVNSKNSAYSLLEGIVGSLDTAGSILLEQSFLQSINDVLTDNAGVVSGIINEILELPARAVPTFSKQIADLVDGTQRTAYEYNQPLETAINNIKAKIPGLSKTLSPIKDTMGRNIQKYGGSNNVFNVFLNPANINMGSVSKGAEEIYRLYKTTGETDIMPRVAPYYINKDGKKIILSSEQRAKYQEVSGDIIEKNVKKLLSTPEYKSMPDSKKAEVINDVVNYSYNIAKKEVLNMEVSDACKKAYEYSKIGNISDYYTFKNSIDDTDKDTKKNSITSFLINSNLNDKQIASLYGGYYSSEKTLDNLLKMNVSLKEFIKFNSKEFVGDINPKTGKTIAGSREKKIISYVNSLKLSVPQKALLIKMEYNSYKKYDKQIIEYVDSQKTDFLDKAYMLKKVGITAYDRQIINYVNQSNKSKEEKAKILKEMGFTVRNGRVYR